MNNIRYTPLEIYPEDLISNENRQSYIDVVWNEDKILNAQNDNNLVTKRSFTSYKCCACKSEYILTLNENITHERIDVNDGYRFEKNFKRSNYPSHDDILYLHGSGHSSGKYICWGCFSRDWFICNYCAQWHHKSKRAKEIESDNVCHACFKKYYRKCSKCNTWQLTSNYSLFSNLSENTIKKIQRKLLSININQLCNRCVKEIGKICLVCNQITLDNIDIENFPVSEQEAIQKLYNKRGLYLKFSICENCFDTGEYKKYIKSCYYCGKILLHHCKIAETKDAWDTTHDRLNLMTNRAIITNNQQLRNKIDRISSSVVCSKCYTDKVSRIKNYDYTPRIYVFHTSHSSKPIPLNRLKLHHQQKLFYGVELEVENKKWDMLNSEMAYILEKKYKNLVYTVHDGTVSKGFEIVFYPFTYNWYKKNKRNTIASLLKLVKDRGYTSYETGNAGIHIHISRNAFNSGHMSRFHWFFYNPEVVENLLHSISQRGATGANGDDMCQWNYRCFNGNSRMYKTQSIRYNKRLVQNKKETIGDKYTTLNLDHRHTIECRIFRGTLNLTSFCKNIEFIESVYNFTSATGRKNINTNNYLDYITNQDNPKRYQNLVKFCVGKNLL